MAACPSSAPPSTVVIPPALSLSRTPYSATSSTNHVATYNTRCPLLSPIFAVSFHGVGYYRSTTRYTRVFITGQRT